MFNLGSPAPRQAVPVVPGPVREQEACAACGSTTAPRNTQRVEGIVMELCHNAMNCTGRYRRGVSPATYAAGLRGEILAVAP